MSGNDNLVEYLRRNGFIVSEQVYMAFKAVDRALFVPEDRMDEAYLDTPLPIGHMQTISAPSMVAIMVEALMLEPGMKVLEVGAGSGYHAAIVAQIVKPGMVYTVERIPELAEMARRNLKKAGMDNVIVVEGDGSVGLPEHAPYDRIYMTAASPRLPKHLLPQVKDGGIILAPVGRSRWGQDLIRLTRIGDDYREENLGGCIFVPLKGKMGFR